MATMRIIVEGVKSAGNEVNKTLITTLMTVNSRVNVPIVAMIIRYMQDLWELEARERSINSKTPE